MQQFTRKVASRAATVVGTAVIVTVVVSGSLSVAQAATEAVANNSVNSAKIANNSIQGVDVKNGTIQSIDIQNETVTGTDVDDGSLSGADIADNTVGSADIADASIGGADISNDAIGSAAIDDGSVTPADLSSAILPPPVAGVVTIDNADAADLVRDRGVDSFTRSSAGVYDFFLSTGVVITNCYLTASMNGFSTGDSGLSIATEIKDFGFAIRMFDSTGAATDPAAGEGFTFVVNC